MGCREGPAQAAIGGVLGEVCVWMCERWITDKDEEKLTRGRKGGTRRKVTGN